MAFISSVILIVTHTIIGGETGSWVLLCADCESLVAVLVLFQVAMSRPGMVIPVTVLVMMMVVGVTPATTPAADCNAATASLSPCFEYVTGTGATPPKECCSGLSTLNANSPSCLCQLITQLNGSSSAASSVNITKGLSLPKDCSITLVTTNCPGKNVFRSSTS